QQDGGLVRRHDLDHSKGTRDIDTLGLEGQKRRVRERELQSPRDLRRPEPDPPRDRSRGNRDPRRQATVDSVDRLPLCNRLRRDDRRRWAIHAGREFQLDTDAAVAAHQTAMVVTAKANGITEAYWSRTRVELLD